MAAPAEEWATHPMCWGPRADFVAEYAKFLGIALAEGDITRRPLVSAVARACPHHFLLDPNTGLRAEHTGPTDSLWDHITVEELAEMASADGRKDKLTLIFDQSVDRKKFKDAKELVEQNLQTLRCNHEVHGVAYYVTHVAFIWVSKNQDLLDRATQRLLKHSRLPRRRFFHDGCDRHIGA